jgi:RNA polymerase sigma-70 factor (ECF subfamily)
MNETVEVRAALAGDAGAQQAIYDRYAGRLFTLAFYMLGSRAAAEDALQSIFLKAFAALDRFNAKSALSTWLWRIALNHCNDELKRKRAETVPLETILGSGDDVSPGPSPERQFEARQTETVVGRALMELPPKLRSVVVLRYVENLSYDEIAAALGTSVGTVSSRLSRALAELERILRPLQPRS